LKQKDIPEMVAAKAENSRVEAKTKIAETRVKTKMNYRLAQAEENTHQYLDISNRLKSQKRNIAIMQHLKSNDIQAYLEATNSDFNDIWRDEDKVNELEAKYRNRNVKMSEHVDEVEFMETRKPRNNNYYQQFIDHFPHKDGITNNLIEIAQQFYKLQTPDAKNEFIFDNIVNQNGELRQAVQQYKKDKLTLHSMTAYQDEKLGRGFLPTPAPTKISLNTPPHIVCQEENSQNIGELAREPPSFAQPQRPLKKFSGTSPFAAPFDYEENGEEVVEETNSILES
jgi:hypothetical protein